MPAIEAERTAVGYYRPGDPELDHPGVFWINTFAPRSRSRFELRAICAHESVPGHHVQWSLAREADALPRYRRYAVPTAFIEGWALYCERLAAEMGLYGDELDLLGLWSLQSWRAARLVIDTGIHTKGWSRKQGIEYLRDHSATPERNIVSEIDRYIGNAGQALAYMVGGLQFAGLRRLAQDRLGAAFDPPEFHARLLENGAMPLMTLRGVIERWLNETGAKQRLPGRNLTFRQAVYSRTTSAGWSLSAHHRCRRTARASSTSFPRSTWLPTPTAARVGCPCRRQRAASPTDRWPIARRPAHLVPRGNQLTQHRRSFAASCPPIPAAHFPVAWTDGETVDARVMRPAAFDSREGYPCLPKIHGGPWTQHGECWLDEFQLCAGARFVVRFSNPHGSAGYSESFARKILSPLSMEDPGTAWGGLDYSDLMTVIDTASPATRSSIRAGSE